MDCCVETWKLFTGLAVILVGIYYYLNRKYNYWKSKGINGPKPLPIYGNTMDLYFKSINVVEIERLKKYGLIYGTYFGNIPRIVIADPEIVKQVLVKDFHLFANRTLEPPSSTYQKKLLFLAEYHDWKKIRRIASPAFTSGKLKKIYSMIRLCLQDYMKVLEKYAQSKREIQLKEVNGAFTLDVIARTAFATQTNAHEDKDNPLIKNANALFRVSLKRSIILFVMPKIVFKISFLRNLLVGYSSFNYLIDTAKHIYQQRKTDQNNKHNDFLQLLIDSEREEQVDNELDANEAHHVNEDKDDDKDINKQVLSDVTDKKLDEVEIISQCFQFLLAGYETTGSTLSYCFFELSRNQQVQDKLYEEIINSQDQNGNINYETLIKMTYLDAVISETLRMYPPLVKLDRRAESDYMIKNDMITIPKGMIVEIPVYAIHHSAEFYDRPEEFIPERFLPENRDKIIPYTYLPFGAGPRNCVGMRFALLEVKIALVNIIKQFRFKKSNKTGIPLKFTQSRMFLLPPNDFYAIIEKRS